MGDTLFAIAGALLVGLSLGIFGSGGSILTVPVLIYLLVHDTKIAIAESLAIVGAIAFIGALPYARAGLVEWRTVVMFGVPAMAGTYLGAWLAGYVPGYAQLFVFAFVMLLASQRMWRKASGKQASPTSEEPRSIVKIGIDGLGVGALTGFVGVGGGFMIVPALVLLGGLPMRRAVATSLMIIALKSGVGFVKYLDVLRDAEGAIDWTTIGVFVAFGAIGSFTGKALGGRINQARLQKGFAVFLVVMACFILVRESVALLAGADDAPQGEAESVPE
ncbi:MAG: sulfite exporter TauE/SafE family protein [Phycisphaerales bacterium JB043]